jgi:tetratricopeptide (TPR) repeat protein
MKLYLACAVLFSLLLPAGAQETGKPSAADILDRVRPSVVKLSVVDAKKQKSSGSGVFLTANGQILTCYHVIANAKTVVASLADGSTAKVTGVVAFSASQDWAVVQSDARNAVPAKRGKASALRQGDRIYTLGAPLGLDLTASDGMVSSIREIEGVGLYLQITAPISHGSSGGPVLNTDGEVVGIAAFVLTKGDSLNFAVSISNVVASWTGQEKPRPFQNSISSTDENRPKNTAPNKSSVAELYAKALAVIPPAYDSPGAREAYKRALGFLQEASRLNPDDVDVIYLQGWCYYYIDDVVRAADMFRDIIKRSPNHADAHMLLGRALKKMGMFDDAIAEFRTAIRLIPDDAFYHYSLGNAYENTERWNDAIAAYRTSIRLKPNDAHYHYCLGYALRELGKWDDAIREFKVATRMNPDDPLYYSSLGIAYERKRKWDDAIVAYRNAIRLEPDNVLAHAGMGYCMLKKGNRTEALAEYTILKRLDPELAESLFNVIYPSE